jgi:hypothetical protein
LPYQLAPARVADRFGERAMADHVLDGETLDGETLDGETLDGETLVFRESSVS